MQRSNFVGEVRTVLMSPVVIAGICAGAFVCLNGVSATEYRGHGPAHARYAGHHLMPMDASNAAFGSGGFGQSAPADGGVSSMAAAQASAAGIPASLVARVIERESGGNPRAVHAGNYGLMQIRLGTARAMGYTGSAAGLLDPQTNMTYAVRYLAGAYRAAGGNESRAVALYARGYYAEAKTRGFSPYASAAAGVTPVMLPMAEPAGAAPVYRVKHYRRHAV
jgi:soluble lytic murein transglycosylase-like protein